MTHNQGMKVTFHCKDPLISSYCQERFGPIFTRELKEMDPDFSGLSKRWDSVLEKEAIRQQWWDYDTDHGDRRFVKKDDQDNPIPLIPSIVIVS